MQRRHPARLAIATLSAGAVLAVGSASPAGADAVRDARSVGPTVSKVTVAGQKVTVRGKVALRRNTAAARKAARVTVTLIDAARKSERKVVKLNRQRGFVATRTTKLRGSLTVRVTAAVAGKRLGRQVSRKVTVRAPATGLANGPLVGTFRIDPGSTTAGPPSGSYFQMVQSNGQPLENFSSPSANKQVTPLRPGSDGGLRTDVFQAPPTPAFAGGAIGGALANRIVAPAPFFGVDFSVVTAPTDPQTATPDPLPEIVNTGGRLSGQVTAWAAQWNGESFNQGTPKPDGSAPAPTTGLTGSVNPTTRRFTLEWSSRIVGGPFNGFAGRWHLEGQFVPAAP